MFPTSKKLFRYKKRFLVLALSALALLGSQCGKKPDSLPQADNGNDQPYQEFINSKMSFYSGKYLQWMLESKSMRKAINDTARTLSVPVRLSVYDTLGKRNAYVLADSGFSDNAMNTFTVWGNVLVKAKSDSLTIRTEKLLWNKLSHRVTSDTYVEIKTEKGDILRGKGLDADENFTRWKLLRGVSGSFPNFRERMDQGNEF